MIRTDNTTTLKNALTKTASDWLTTHDSKVRDDALEECAKMIERTNMGEINHLPKMQLILSGVLMEYTKGIRSMKGTK